MNNPRVPVQILERSARLQAALKFAAGATQHAALSTGLCFLCEQLAAMCSSPVALVYVLEPGDELVLRGMHGYERREVLGEVRLKVGQGITGTCVETLRPVTVDDARQSAQFEYFPQLAEERYPAYLAVPLLSGGRPRGALVLQRERGPFSEDDLLLAVAATRALSALIDAQRPDGAHVLLHGEGNRRGRALGLATLVSRALPRRDPKRATRGELAAAFAAVREEVLQLAGRARAALQGRSRALEEICTSLEDVRLEERAHEHLEAGVPPALALERIAGEVARALADQGPAARRAIDIEAFLGAVAYRIAGQEPPRVRRGELLIAVGLSGLAALRGWSAGATGAVCVGASGESTGAELLSDLGLPVISGVRQIFVSLSQGDRVAIDGDNGEVIVHPSATEAAAWRR